MIPKNLPPELIHMVLSLVPRDLLASSSLVCKAWRTVALPTLYRSIILTSITKGSHLTTRLNPSAFNNYPEEFIDRVACETNKDGYTFQFSNCVRRLTVAWGMNEKQLQCFESAVLRMKNLQHLTWMVSVLKINWYDTLASLCRSLPELRSVRLILALNDLGISNKSMGALINLKELSIGFDEQDPKARSLAMVPNTTIRFIAGAQNIESLSILCQDTCMNGLTIPYILGVEATMTMLSSYHFPHLRKLQIGPFCHQVPLHKFNNPDFVLWRFAQIQKQLREVAMCTYEGSNRTIWRRVDLNISHDAENVMPSMPRFVGQPPLIPDLLSSNFAHQLKVLDIIHIGRAAPGALSDLVQALRRFPSVELPRLSRLRISIQDLGAPNDNERAVNVVEKLTSAAPVLEELIICSSQSPTAYNQEDILRVLAKLPNLHRLGFTKDWLRVLESLTCAKSFSKSAQALCRELIISNNPEFSLSPL